MFIHSVKINNFRCLEEAEVEFDELTVILGRNGAGKSSICQALSIFYDVSYSATEEDFYGRVSDNPITIKVTYKDLSKLEQEEFSPYLRNKQLSVIKKLVFGESGKYYAATMQVPEFAAVRLITNKTQLRTRYNKLREEDEKFQELPTVRSADQCEKNMYQFEKNHPELCELTEKQTQFFGPPSIGGGKLDKYTRYVLVPAVKEITDELSQRGKTYLQQLLDLVVLRKVESRGDVRELKQKFEEEVRRVYSSDNLTELPELGQGISELLARYAPGAQFHLEWGEVEPPTIRLPPASASLTEDGFRGDIGRKGHGLQRSLIFAVLEYLNKLSPEKPPGEAMEDEESGPTPDDEPLSPNLILAIEEPELYQHPLKCRFLSKLLRDLAASGENQIIYTTHSPYFVDLDRYNKVRLVRKINADGRNLKCGQVCYCKEEKIIKDLAYVAGRPETELSMPAFLARASAVMDAIVNEGFFADAVVVVEGLSDYGCLWTLQEILRQDWAGRGIAVVPASGKNNLEKPTLIFRNFSIPIYLIFDADSSKRNTSEEAKTAKSNQKVLRLVGARAQDFPPTTIENSWACFEDDLERCIKEQLGEGRVNELAGAIKSDFGYDETRDVFKNLEGMTRFVHKVYEDNLSLLHLEALVKKISSLVN